MVAKAATKSGEFFCFHCGKAVQKQDIKCKHCGVAFDKISEAFRCPRCSNLLPVGAAACPACGLGFKVRSVSTGTKMSEDDKFLSKLIDWSEQSKASGSKPAAPGSITRIVKTPPPPPPPPSDSTLQRKVRTDESKIPGRTIDGKSLSSLTHAAKPPSTSKTGIKVDASAVKNDSFVEKEEITEPASAVAKDADIQLSNQALQNLLDERNKEIEGLKSREQELVRREEHINRKIREYAMKKKELDSLQKEISVEEKAQIQENDGAVIKGDEIEMQSENVDGDERQVWLKDQTKIKAGLIEIRSQLGPRKPTSFYEQQVPGDIAEKIEVLEEKLIDVTKERDDLEEKMKTTEAVRTDIITLLKILDQLLGKLPPEIIDEFSKSKDFKLYEKVLDELNI